MRNLFIFLFIIVNTFVNAQELKCTVRVNAQKLPPANQRATKSLENSLNEFVNNTIWSTTVYKQNEKINCSMTIDIDTYESDTYVGSIQIQSSRVAFNSTYATPIFNFNDKNISFRYLEFEPLLFNPNNFDSNLLSTVAFYANMIIALDQDSMSNLGGTKVLEQAQNITNIAQSSGYKGWTQNDGNNSRYFLINDMLSDSYSQYRTAMFEYNFQGIDVMEKSPRIAKEKIIEALSGLKKLHNFRLNSFLMRVFFDIKGDEIVSIFSGGPNVSMTDMIDNLNRFSPLNNVKWNSIKN